MLLDPEAGDLLPERLGEDSVAACRSAIAVRIRHGVEGSARAEVWLGEEPSALVCIWDDDFVTDSGHLALSDAGNEQVVRASVRPGTRRVRVFVDDPADPQRVVFEVGPVAASS